MEVCDWGSISYKDILKASAADQLKLHWTFFKMEQIAGKFFFFIDTHNR